MQNVDGSFTITPTADFYGPVTLNYNVSDGTAAVATSLGFTIDDVPDDVLAPTDIRFTLASTASAFTASLTAGGTLGSFTAVDGDSATWSFTLGGTNASLFTLSPTSGGSVGLLVGAANIDIGNYSFTVTATDAGGNNYVETYTLSVGSSNGATGDTTAAFTITAGTDIDFGINGPDSISGGAGDDALAGGNQSDNLFGGLGNDQLLGGAQSDNFIFNTALDATNNVDVVMDFNAANADKIHLENAVFTQLAATGTLAAANFVSNVGGNAVDANDYVLYDSATGNLYYDTDGSGAGAKVLFATISLAGVGGTVDAGDFIVI